jgi:hypothetical protein
MAIYLREARRAPGSEWLKDHPKPLESSYHLTRRVVERIYPFMRRLLGPVGTQRFMAWGERWLKGYLFNCQMCGQCILHSTGMTCPMNCPKKLRNGPCGGVRHNEHCEVIPERMCVWVQAFQRSQRGAYGPEMCLLQPPVNNELANMSAWANMSEGLDLVRSTGWEAGELASVAAGQAPSCEVPGAIDGDGKGKVKEAAR